MLVVISPAKKLDFEPLDGAVARSVPDFQGDANRLVRIAKKLSVEELRKLMSISEDLATLNKARFKGFAKESTERNSKQAMFAFAGDTYQGLDAACLDAGDRGYAQDHLRILSGLYGVLKPHDMIQPYRLEMGSRLSNKEGPHLYAYWGKKLARVLDAAAQGGVVVNCASNEYFKAANEKAMKARVITPAFKEDTGSELKMIGFFAKRARGAMARFMIQNRIETPEGLKDFDLDGYKFRADLSDERTFTFSRAATT